MKTVLINGGSRGIGRAVAELFAKRGWHVAFTYKNSKDAAEELALKTGALAIAADTALEADVVRAVALTLEKFGTVDCLVNCAARSSFSLFTDITLSDWNELMAVNLTGTFLFAREVSREMIRKKQGRIINITSMWGAVGASCEVHYSASKAAVIGMTKALAKELGPSGITVNAIAPGVIDTDMNAALSDEDKRALRDETPLMRIGKPEEVAQAVYFLASDAAAFITGEIMNVSGGFVVY